MRLGIMNKQITKISSPNAPYLIKDDFQKLERLKKELSKEKQYSSTLAPFLKEIERVIKKSRALHEKEIRKKDLQIKSLKERVLNLEKIIESDEEEKFRYLKANFDLLRQVHKLKITQENSKEYYNQLKDQIRQKSETNHDKLNGVLLKQIRQLEGKITDLNKQKDWLARSLVEKFNELGN